MSNSRDPTVEALLDTETPKEQQIKELGTLVDRLKVCMFVTLDKSGKLASRCMRLQHFDHELNFWFFTNDQSHKMRDLDHTRQVNLSFLDVNTQEWVSVSASVAIVKDQDKIKQLYSEDMKAWLTDLRDGKHDASPEDPRLTLLKVMPNTVHYFIQSGEGVASTSAGQFMDVVKGVMVGKTPQSLGRIRELKEKDIEAAKIMLSQKED